jgi:hypothetical protein
MDKTLDNGLRMARVRQIFQFRLHLEEVRPLVWRRIQIADDSTLARLHKVIQAVMAWEDYHLHEFTIRGYAYGEPESDEEQRLIDDRTVRLRNLNLKIGERIQYAYDFGDDWQHVLEVEEKMAPAPD